MTLGKIWANLGVEDVKRTQEFYLALGFEPNGNPSTDLVSFLFGKEKFVIHFFEKQRLKTSLEGEVADLQQGNEIMFTLSAESKEEMHQWMDTIKKAGGTIRFDPRKNRKKFYDDNGYYVSVFADPDGHLFNLFCNLNR
ncbi:glyoxalase/bleomycin resistance/extradiol dioxygenase family protein [Flagellimonas olearia]|uniref:Glyoxalase/bleomycin resistance/extradiol dioxygenase family protein n=1 Tax=Flagellimonas olearia TaxID=552546 RepID=A0A6I1DYC2_9FLAO|nr:VOC family protein [Allomuricauda olearia]KAB7530278.1 glyoxalase/bleomycin resistance/extradiol dioxygenase family protein [Allomuricauda olearia]